MASIHDILRPITFTKVVSRVAAASSQMLNFFGMQPGGPLEKDYGHGRQGNYHIFNNVRTVALGTAPGAPAARRSRNNVGDVAFSYPRMHIHTEFLLEELNQFSQIGDPTKRDEAGANFLVNMMKKPAQEAANWRAALLMGMLRDSLYFHKVGLYWYPDYTSSNSLYQVQFRMPAGNKTQLNILDKDDSTSINGSNIIDTSWDNPNANIPLHCQLVDAAIFRRTGEHIKTIMVRTQQWNNITNNNYIAVGAGSANPPFTRFQREVGTNPDGSPFMAHVATVNTIPGIEFIINDEGLDLGNPESPTWTYHLESTSALFLPEIDSRLFEGLVAGEPIREYDAGPVTMKRGLQAWSTGRSNPTVEDLFQLDNFFPIPYNPGTWAYGTVQF